ncbi:hypothetical protein [Microbulbifer epialgicus]|uniref:Holin of 3TMs, for gene-transfer release n=1 Tax=Microbulbifer epialgicus TaxID=393907 RepID=A0ABV4P3W3_9GAMM
MNWKAIVKSVAPTLGAALGGPVTGTAVKFLAEHLLGDSEAQEQDIAELVSNASPERLLELRSLDNEFKLRMRELDIDVYALEVDDRKSARDMGVKSGLAAQMALSIAFIGGYFALLFALFSGEVTLSPELRDMCVLMLGVMTGEIPRVMAFWFGSSQGSKEKTHALVK